MCFITESEIAALIEEEESLRKQVGTDTESAVPDRLAVLSKLSGKLPLPPR